MFERYTESARRAIFFARYEAMERGAKEIEPRDLVLGLARDVHQAPPVMVALHQDADKLRTLLLAPPDIGESSKDQNIPLAAASKEALTYGAEQANLDHSQAINIDHLLLGVMRAHPPTATILAGAGFTLESMRPAPVSAQSQAASSSPEAVLEPHRPRIGSQNSPLRGSWFKRHPLRIFVALCILLVLAVFFIVWLRE